VREIIIGYYNRPRLSDVVTIIIATGNCRTLMNAAPHQHLAIPEDDHPNVPSKLTELVSTQSSVLSAVSRLKNGSVQKRVE